MYNFKKDAISRHPLPDLRSSLPPPIENSSTRQRHAPASEPAKPRPASPQEWELAGLVMVGPGLQVPSEDVVQLFAGRHLDVRGSASAGLAVRAQPAFKVFLQRQIDDAG